MHDDPDASDAAEDGPEEQFASGLSDDGILLFFAAAACLLAATTAHTTGQPRPVTVFAVLAGVPAAVAFVADALSGYVPATGIELLVGGAAIGGGIFAIPGRYYVNVATLFVASLLVLWRVYDVEVRGTER